MAPSHHRVRTRLLPRPARAALGVPQAEPEGPEGSVQMWPARLSAAYTHINPTESEQTQLEPTHSSAILFRTAVSRMALGRAWTIGGSPLTKSPSTSG